MPKWRKKAAPPLVYFRVRARLSSASRKEERGLVLILCGPLRTSTLFTTNLLCYRGVSVKCVHKPLKKASPLRDGWMCSRVLPGE